MFDGHWCSTCGNELARMGPHRLGCVPCYVSTGPDWQARWLVDCAAAAREVDGANVIFLRLRGSETVGTR